MSAYDFNWQQVGADMRVEKSHKAQPPMPEREELIKRNSFGSVNDNKLLDKLLGKQK